MIASLPSLIHCCVSVSVYFRMISRRFGTTALGASRTELAERGMVPSDEFIAERAFSFVRSRWSFDPDRPERYGPRDAALNIVIAGSGGQPVCAGIKVLASSGIAGFPGVDKPYIQLGCMKSRISLRRVPTASNGDQPGHRPLAMRYSVSDSTAPPLSPKYRRASSRTAARISLGRAASA